MKPAKGRFGATVATLLIVGEMFFVGGGVVFAQTTTDVTETVPIEEVIAIAPIVVSDETPASVVSTSTDVTIDTDLQGASSTPLLQETFSDQQTITLDQASSTADVTFATTTDAVGTDPIDPIIESNASTTQEEATISDVTPPTTEPEIISPPEELIVPQIEPLQDQSRMVLSAESLRPESKYVFSISGKKIATTRRVAHTRLERFKTVVSEVSEVVNPAPQVVADNVKGVMSVSGACEDKYYVILVYRNPEDYARDPRTYVVNRSFPCVNGSFSYDVTDLPPSLQDGNYYLLVGSMGEIGPWTPITGITEITLARDH